MNKERMTNSLIITGAIIFIGIAVYFFTNKPSSLSQPNNIPVTTTQEKIQIEGTVIEVITAKGTKSENHYFKIKDHSGKEEYLFNDAGRNVGFEGYLNKKIKVTGYAEIGKIGWQGEEVLGIYVEKIE